MISHLLKYEPSECHLLHLIHSLKLRYLGHQMEEFYPSKSHQQLDCVFLTKLIDIMLRIHKNKLLLLSRAVNTTHSADTDGPIGSWSNLLQQIKETLLFGTSVNMKQILVVTELLYLKGEWDMVII